MGEGVADIVGLFIVWIVLIEVNLRAHAETLHGGQG